MLKNKLGELREFAETEGLVNDEENEENNVLWTEKTVPKKTVRRRTYRLLKDFLKASSKHFAPISSNSLPDVRFGEAVEFSWGETTIAET